MAVFITPGTKVTHANAASPGAPRRARGGGACLRLVDGAKQRKDVVRRRVTHEQQVVGCVAVVRRHVDRHQALQEGLARPARSSEQPRKHARLPSRLAGHPDRQTDTHAEQSRLHGEASLPGNSAPSPSPSTAPYHAALPCLRCGAMQYQAMLHTA
jgi:hypothetical protein